MYKQLLLSTAVGLILGTAAFAQSPSGSTSSPTSAQTQTNSPTNSTNARQPNAHRRLTLPRGASRQIPRRTNPPCLHLVAPRRRKLLVPPPVLRKRKPRLPHNRPRLLRPKPTSHLRRTARPSRPRVPGPEIPTRLRSNLINQTSRALRSRRRPTATRRCTSTISKERE